VNSKFLTTGYEIISKLRNKEMMPDIKEKNTFKKIFKKR